MVEIEVEYDREIDAAYLKLSENEVERCVSLSEYVVADLDKKGHLVGIELLFASEQMPDCEHWLNTPDAADYLNVALETLRLWTKKGHVPAYKFNRRNRYRKTDLDTFIEEHKVRTN